MEDDLFDFKISSKEDFGKFTKMLHADFLKNGNDWENNTLESFLEAMSAYCGDTQAVYKNNNENKNADLPSWETFADILRSSIIYE